MIADLKPYPAMKDSGVEWLGDIPEHWDLVPNRSLLKLKKQVVGDRADEYTLLSLTKRGIIIRDMENPEGKFPASFDTYQVVEPGDLIFCLFDIDETPRTVGLSSINGMITAAYTRFACPDEQTRQFIYLLYLSLDNKKLLKPLYSGLRKVITKSTFLSAKLALPPIPEQTAIVRFLNYIDQRVQRHICAKQKLIGLLEEQKQAIIHRAVTRGLDPDVPFKPSDVEWLGDVPEHWEVLRTRYLFNEIDLRSTTGKETHLSMSQRLGLVPSHMVERTLISESYVGGKLCEQDDLVLNRLKAHLGVFALAKQSGVISPDYSIFRKGRPIRMEYFEHVLKSPACRTELRIRAKGIVEGFWRLYTDDFYNIRVPVPPVEEQEQIVGTIEKASANIDTTIDRAQREIELLHEYRTRLIADLVTGKLDVREAVAQLPDELEALDKADDLIDDGAFIADGLDTTPEETEA